MAEDVIVGTASHTADVASEALDSLEAAETGGDTHAEIATENTVSGTDAPDEAPAVVAAEPAKPPSEVEALLQEAGYGDERRPDGRENRIPYSKVRRIIENGLKKGRDAQTAEQARIEAEARSYREQVDQLRQGVQGDPEAFLRELSQVDPRYAAFLQRQAAQAEAQAAPAAVEMPQPDIRLPDGSQTYSLDGLRRLMAWNAAQVEAKVEQRLKPLAEREREAAERARHDEARQQMAQRTSALIDEAATWPGFTDAEGDILAALQADSAEAARLGQRPKLTLEGAYRKVVIGRLSTDRTKMREELLRELQAAPKSTATGRAATDAPKPGAGGGTTADAASRAYARLERG
jgi:hypothetical protein